MENRDDLIDRLLTLAGTIMEDTAPVALISTSAGEATGRVTVVREAGEAITKLALAADAALQNHGGVDR